jgi:hypothetical protein
VIDFALELSDSLKNRKGALCTGLLFYLNHFPGPLKEWDCSGSYKFENGAING